MQASKNLSKKANKFSEALQNISKNGDEVAESVVDVGKTVDKSFNNLKPQNLLDELANSGVKYNPDEVITIIKTPNGKLLWLEKGNINSGLTHILQRHGNDFAAQGITDIPQLLNDILKTTPVQIGNNSKGLFATYIFNSNTYKVAYGTNGYIVSFYPID